MGQTQRKRVPRGPKQPTNVTSAETQQENLQHIGYEAVKKMPNRGVEEPSDECR